MDAVIKTETFTMTARLENGFMLAALLLMLGGSLILVYIPI